MGLADGMVWEKEGQVGVKMVTGQGEMKKTKEGANREANDGRGRFDLFPYEAMEALAKWYEAGANKYEERNWEKGISVKDCINRMTRHALKAANGWTDEDHLAAVMWNAAAAITMMKRRPDCNDHPWKEEKEKSDKEQAMMLEEYLKKKEEYVDKQFEIFKDECGFKIILEEGEEKIFKTDLLKGWDKSPVRSITDNDVIYLDEDTPSR